MITALMTLMFACGDAEEKQDIPPPPQAPAVEQPKAEVQAPKPTPEPVEAAQEDVSAKDGEATTDIGGTKPEVKKSEKLMTTGEIQAPQSKLLADKVEKQLKGKAQSEGYGSITNFKLIKNECKAGGTCTGVGQATAVKTTITYVEGNGITVKQEDSSTKDAIITKVDGDNFTVQYADGTEAVVSKDLLGLRK